MRRDFEKPNLRPHLHRVTLHRRTCTSSGGRLLVVICAKRCTQGPPMHKQNSPPCALRGHHLTHKITSHVLNGPHTFMHADLNLAGLNMWRDDPQWSSLLPPPGPTRCAGALLVGAAADTSNSVAMDPSYPYTIVDASQLQQLEPGLAPGVYGNASTPPLAPAMRAACCFLCTWRSHGSPHINSSNRSS